MRFKSFTVVAALALCGSGWAQTVPAEAWVGPPIPTSAGILDRSTVVADMQRSLSAGRAPQEAWVGAASDLSPPVGAMTRAEVVADLKLFDRAGLLSAQGSEVFNPFSAPMQQRAQVYMNLRQGQAYPREVARLEGRDTQSMTSAAAAD